MLDCEHMDKIILSGVIGVLIGFAGSQLMTMPEGHEHANKYHAMDEHSEDDHNTVHSHDMVAVSDDTLVPSVTIEAIKDTKDGYNIRIDTENYIFNPESVNEENVQNEGHAHIYVNDKKIARLYGNWFHLSNDMLQNGENAVKVTLNSNDHSEWSVDGNAIADVITVTK